MKTQDIFKEGAISLGIFAVNDYVSSINHRHLLRQFRLAELALTLDLTEKTGQFLAPTRPPVNPDLKKIFSPHQRRTQVHKFIAILLQPLMSRMPLVSLHSLILLVRTETEG
jgi:hypothetical protein